MSVKKTKARILVVSRDESDIRSEILKNAAIHVVYECKLSKNHVQSDVALFSRSIVNRRLSNKVDALREEIASQIAKKSNDMFF